MGDVKIGLYLPQLRMSVDTIVERVTAAETAGFDSVWFMDHLAAPGMPQADTLEAWTLTAAVAARTERIRLGHLVGCDPFRHPSLLAKMAVTVDAISGGRLDLGLGWGSVEPELESFGFGPDTKTDRAARLRETLEVLELLFTGEPVSYQGQFVTLREAVCRPTPVQARIPLHIGGAGPTLTMPLVREFADWWNCPSYGFDRFDELVEQAGEGTRISVQHPVGFVPQGGNRDEIVSTAQRRFGSWGGLVVGDADDIVEGLRPELDAGVELLILQFSDFGAVETIRAFAEEVLPRLRSPATAG